MIDRRQYSLAEGMGGVCEGCALTEYCDRTAEELHVSDYMLCAEEEDFEMFQNPVYIKKENR